MTNENADRIAAAAERAERRAAAAERIAAALEKIAAAHAVTAAGPQPFAGGDLIGVPVLETPNYSPSTVRPWHAATYVRGQDAVPRCGVKGLSKVSMSEAMPIGEVPRERQCGSPGCAQQYAEVRRASNS